MIIFANFLLVISGILFCLAGIHGDNGVGIFGLMFMFITVTITLGYHRWVR